MKKTLNLSLSKINDDLEDALYMAFLRDKYEEYDDVKLKEKIIKKKVFHNSKNVSFYYGVEKYIKNTIYEYSCGLATEKINEFIVDIVDFTNSHKYNLNKMLIVENKTSGDIEFYNQEVIYDDSRFIEMFIRIDGRGLLGQIEEYYTLYNIDELPKEMVGILVENNIIEK